MTFVTLYMNVNIQNNASRNIHANRSQPYANSM